VKVLKIIKRIDVWMGKLAKWMLVLAACMSLFMMFNVSADILGRYLFSHSIIGTPTIARNLLISILFLGLPWVTRCSGHIRSDMILDRSSTSMKLVLECISNIFGIFIFAFFSIAQIGPLQTAIRIGEFDVEATFYLPLVPFYWIAVIGSAVAVWQDVRNLIVLFFNFKKGKMPGEIKSGGAII
jgi:TRAP-type C4-dicarboxylate transport system permease small subunit